MSLNLLLKQSINNCVSFKRLMGLQFLNCKGTPWGTILLGLLMRTSRVFPYFLGKQFFRHQPTAVQENYGAFGGEHVRRLQFSSPSTFILCLKSQVQPLLFQREYKTSFLTFCRVAVSNCLLIAVLQKYEEQKVCGRVQSSLSRYVNVDQKQDISTP